EVLVQLEVVKPESPVKLPERGALLELAVDLASTADDDDVHDAGPVLVHETGERRTQRRRLCARGARDQRDLDAGRETHADQALVPLRERGPFILESLSEETSQKTFAQREEVERTASLGAARERLRHLSLLREAICLTTTVSYPVVSTYGDGVTAGRAK